MYDKSRKGYYELSKTTKSTFDFVLDINKRFVELGQTSDNFNKTYLPFFLLLNNWKWCNYRQVYPSRDAGLICENTSILNNLTGVDIHQPKLPCFAINVPRNLNLWSEPTGYMTHVIVDFSERVQIPKGFPIQLLELFYSCVGKYMILFMFEKTPPKELMFPPKMERFTDENGNIETGIIGGESALGPELLYKALGWTFNMCILMKSYPNYVDSEQVSLRVKDQVVKSQEFHVHLGREIKFEHSIPNPEHRESVPTGRHMPTHWRVGHWRRQPHGLNWQGDAKIGTFPDGRNYHMVLIPPVLINSEAPNEVVGQV